MKQTLLVANLILSAALIAAAQKTPESMLGAALHQEEVQGDLKGAIAAYQKVVLAALGVSRKTVAEALVHMGQCYEKLGDSESRKAYERVVRDYADQKEAVTLARARLGTSNTARLAKGDRAVWTGPMVDLFGQVSPDGKLITYIDWNTGRLMAHEVAGNVDRALTKAIPGFSQFAEYSTISRDSKQVAYAWFNEKGRYELRVAALQGSGLLEPRPFYPGSDDIKFISPRDWSPDGKWISVAIKRKDGTGQIALVAVADGTLRVLKSISWNGPDRISFSLDGRYIAFDLPASDNSDQRDVFVLAVDGSREIPAVVHPAQETVMGWSPDGTQLLFSSDRTGSVGLWALPFADGKPSGSPELVRPDIGSSCIPGSSCVSMGLTASGALYLYKNISSRDIKIAPIDLNAGKLLGPPASFSQGFLLGAGVPDWSPDGKYLVYQACDGRCIAVRSVDTGEVRRLPPTLLYVREPRWSPDGMSFITAGRDQKGRDGIFRIDAQSGQLSPVIYGSGLRGPEWSGDGKSIYYFKRSFPTGGSAFLERSLVSETEREIIRLPDFRRELNVSPDGRYFAVRTEIDPSTKSSTLILVPVEGGQTRELLRLSQPDQWGAQRTTAWTPDSRAVIVTKKTGSSVELLLVPITGEPPRKLDINAESWTRGTEAYRDQGFSLSPDGRHIAFLMGKSGSEIWALENFLPVSSAKR